MAAIAGRRYTTYLTTVSVLQVLLNRLLANKDIHRRLVHGRFPHRARCPGMLFPRSSVIQPSPSASSDNPWKLIFSTTILTDSVSLLFCTFIGFLQFRHRTRFRDSFYLASVFKCLFTYLLTYINQNPQLHVINISFSSQIALVQPNNIIVNTTSHDLQLVWIGIEIWCIKNGPGL